MTLENIGGYLDPMFRGVIYVGDISGIFRVYFGDVSGMFRGYFGDKFLTISG